MFYHQFVLSWKMRTILVGLVILFLNVVVLAEPNQRAIPQTLPSHPGNIFLAGEQVVVERGKVEGESWKTLNYEGQVVTEGRFKEGKAELGKLPVGYYEVVSASGNNSNHVSIGVLEPLHAPTPRTSPIGIDVAMAWFFSGERMKEVASLCQLAGMNRVRDRLLWEEMEPKRGEFVKGTRYDAALQVQSVAGLQVLQVNHLSAKWANPDVRRFPSDLRDIHDFYRQMAQHWRGKIEAFEPWNEADLDMFGGHTGSEMASLQKAAYLGLKAGNPDLTVCMNVFAIHRQTTLRNFNDNRAWAYFDTFNLHHYEPLEVYPKIYEDFRAVSAGKPMWVTECNVTVDWSGDEQLKEPNAENARLQSERVTKIYSQTIHEGVKAVFYFMLPHYTERQSQYGLMHPDLTPRPAFVAAAAAGRFLADACPLGGLDASQKTVHGYLFDAKPDGKSKTVLVIWSEKEEEFSLPKPPEACFDHLGRPRSIKGRSIKLTQAPLYVLLADGGKPATIPAPKTPELLSGKLTPVVIQAVLPSVDIALTKSAYQIAANQTNKIPIFVYNFGETKVHGRLNVTVPEKWSAEFPDEVDLAPGERKALTLSLISVKSWEQAARVRINGDFGKAGDQVLALRFVQRSN